MVMLFSAIVACGCCAAAGFNGGLWVAARADGLRSWLYLSIIVSMLLTALVQFWAGWR